jgi:hypothetical protein
VSAKPTPLVPKLNLTNPNKGSKRYDDRIVEMDLADYLNVFHKEEPKKEVVVVQ